MCKVSLFNPHDGSALEEVPAASYTDALAIVKDRLGLLNTQWEADGRSHFRLKYDRSILAIIDESKTEADLNELKENWEADPCWDIEHTVGFGLYRDDLKAYRLAKEAEWEAKRQADLVAFAEKIGATGNLVLAAYVRDLEYRLVALQEKYDKWYFAD